MGVREELCCGVGNIKGGGIERIRESEERKGNRKRRRKESTE